jgi:small subunit ribosomal protein S24e
MKIEILEDKENKLLNRREIRFRVNHDAGTPSRKEVRDALSALLHSEFLIIDWMKTEFGRRELLGYAKVYPSKDEAKRIERRHILIRNSFMDG